MRLFRRCGPALSAQTKSLDDFLHSALTLTLIALLYFYVLWSGSGGQVLLTYVAAFCVVSLPRQCPSLLSRQHSHYLSVWSRKIDGRAKVRFWKPFFQKSCLPTINLRLSCNAVTAGLPMSYKLGPPWNAVITRSDFKSEAIFGFLSPNCTWKSTWFFS